MNNHKLAKWSGGFGEVFYDTNVVIVIEAD